ncbi:A-kinase anchor protein 7-like isoform X2 [Stegodyphus dumicola]|uniref:A-kinase anchor protein 7-like isoform X2 n=1 Tax=Stegodyphus dumicola TaxID=202533 RepID=UPI0015AFC2E4|nr:A-kinase anchor protein 7-like isoform X2 [Stegodyphus dumicola]
MIRLIQTLIPSLNVLSCFVGKFSTNTARYSFKNATTVRFRRFSYFVAGCCFSKSGESAVLSDATSKSYTNAVTAQYNSFGELYPSHCASNSLQNVNCETEEFPMHYKQRIDSITTSSLEDISIHRNTCKRLRNSEQDVHDISPPTASKHPKISNDATTDITAGNSDGPKVTESSDIIIPVSHREPGNTDDNYLKTKQQRPNYFVAVRISDPEICQAVKIVQEHILEADKKFESCMSLLPTLHVTLMVMRITDEGTHKKALQALKKASQEHNNLMCKEPLCIEFKGLGHFNNRVLYAKITNNNAFDRLRYLGECVEKQFAAASIVSSEKRGFAPHLTIAKLNFAKKKHRNMKKIHPSLYEAYKDIYFGCQAVESMQLLKMTGPKDATGYYSGDEVFFTASFYHLNEQADAYACFPFKNIECKIM